MKLLVRNLARSTTEAELREMFESYGRVQSCTLVMDKKTSTSKGFGFIEMPRPGDAKAAMKNLNGKDVAGNKIRVKKAEDKPAAAASPEEAPAPRAQDQAEPEEAPVNPWQGKR
jgi:RNA recognition motif-containing protein